MKDGQQITFTGEGDQEPGLEPGDIVIVLDEKEHSTFQRRETDLLMRMELNLTEALCGCTKTIETLDSRTLVIQTVPGKSSFPSASIATHIYNISAHSVMTAVS